MKKQKEKNENIHDYGVESELCKKLEIRVTSYLFSYSKLIQIRNFKRRRYFKKNGGFSSRLSLVVVAANKITLIYSRHAHRFLIKDRIDCYSIRDIFVLFLEEKKVEEGKGRHI